MTIAAATFCLYVIFIGICAGVVISILVVLPQFLYQLPYVAWVGFTDANAKYPATKNSGFFKDTINATKLYKHWIFHTKLDF